MLPKANRLTKKKDFDKVFLEGKGAKTVSLIGRALKNNLPESRFGFVVSKKISLKATVRNTVKRRLRQAVALQLGSFPGGVDIVIVTLPTIAKKDFTEISQEVSLLLKKLYYVWIYRILVWCGFI